MRSEEREKKIEKVFRNLDKVLKDEKETIESLVRKYGEEKGYIFFNGQFGEKAARELAQLWIPVEFFRRRLSGALEKGRSQNSREKEEVRKVILALTLAYLSDRFSLELESKKEERPFYIS